MFFATYFGLFSTLIGLAPSAVGEEAPTSPLNPLPPMAPSYFSWNSWLQSVPTPPICFAPVAFARPSPVVVATLPAPSSATPAEQLALIEVASLPQLSSICLFAAFFVL